MVLLKFLLSKEYDREQINLHSTMVLLKLTGETALSLTLAKSTFHYGSIKIYTPINLVIFLSLSTFHYGSIKIDNDRRGRRKVQVSTFHYGSIKI